MESWRKKKKKKKTLEWWLRLLMLSASCTSSSDVDVHLHHVLCNGLLGAVGLLELVPEQEIARRKHYCNFASIQ